jgi:hypothetical protein
LAQKPLPRCDVDHTPVRDVRSKSARCNARWPVLRPGPPYVRKSALRLSKWRFVPRRIETINPQASRPGPYGAGRRLGASPAAAERPRRRRTDDVGRSVPLSAATSNHDLSAAPVDLLDLRAWGVAHDRLRLARLSAQAAQPARHPEDSLRRVFARRCRYNKQAPSARLRRRHCASIRTRERGVDPSVSRSRLKPSAGRISGFRRRTKPRRSQ